MFIKQSFGCCCEPCKRYSFGCCCKPCSSCPMNRKQKIQAIGQGDILDCGVIKLSGYRELLVQSGYREFTGLAIWLSGHLSLNYRAIGSCQLAHKTIGLSGYREKHPIGLSGKTIYRDALGLLGYRAIGKSLSLGSQSTYLENY